MSKDVSIRDLRNQGAAVIRRVLDGEVLTVTRGGEPVAELMPRRRRPLTAATVLAHWRALPQTDAESLRRDLDEVLDSRI